jgi:hypothetical protein
MRVFSFVAILWGGAVVGYGLTRAFDGSTSYAVGQVAAFAFGCALFLGGGLAVVLRGRG